MDMRRRIVKALCTAVTAAMAVLLSACVPDIIEDFEELLVQEEREPYPVECFNQYYYTQLNEEQQMIYSCILEGSDTYAQEVEFLHEITQEDLEIAMEAFRCEHPEAFWTAGYSMSYYNTLDHIVSISYNDESDYEAVSEAIRTAAQPVIKEAMQYEDVYDQILYFYDWIIDETVYEKDSTYNQDIRSVFLYHASVCSGYARAFQYFCNEAEIPCAVIRGRTGDESHAWNAVWIDDQPYWVDLTWGDPVFEEDPSMQQKNYDYFCTGDEVLLNTHTPGVSIELSDGSIEDVFVYPVCDDMSRDYYVLQGAYFPDYNDYAVRDFIWQNLDEGENENILLRFGSHRAYEAAFDDLFGENVWGEDILMDWYQCSLRYWYSYNDKSCTMRLSVYPQ